MDDNQHKASLASYWRCLHEHKEFRLLWLADTIDMLGAWFTYVATLSLVEQLTDSSGLALSGVVLIRFLPSLLLAPLSGVLADRLNRLSILISMALLGGSAVAAMSLISRPSQLALLFLLLALQFTASAFYAPARSAMLPAVVPSAVLHLAATLESFSWSVTGAAGASLGGLVASHLGPSACFLIDAVSYVLSAACAALIPHARGEPGAAMKQEGAATMAGGADGATMGGESMPGTPAAAAAATAAAAAGQGLVRSQSNASDLLEALLPSARGEDAVVQVTEGEGSSPRAERSHRHWASGLFRSSYRSCSPERRDSVQDAEPSRGWGESLHEVWSLVSSRQHRGVAALLTIKACGAITWGSMDLLSVKFAAMPSMQWLGDSDATLGLIFGLSGLGCFVGPILFNAFVPPLPTPLLWAVVLGFAVDLAGYALLIWAPNIVVVLVSTFGRAIGSASLWVYSTLLLQLKVPHALLGRVSALELALYTLAEAASSVLTGAALDATGLGVRGICVVLTAVQAVITASWLAYVVASRQ